MIRTQIQVSEELKSRELGTEITETAAMYEQYLGVRLFPLAAKGFLELGALNRARVAGIDRGRRDARAGLETGG